MKDVLTKNDFVRRYATGEFGNASPTWNDVNTFLEYISVTPPPLGTMFHLRNRIKGGPTFYNLPCDDRIFRENLSSKNFYVSEMAPTHRTVLQGELQLQPGGAYLYYSRIKKPMRDALKSQSRVAKGFKANGILHAVLCSNSMAWLQHLLAEYPDHVIEFSTYDIPWGTIPNHNTVFWEVRKY